MANATAEEVEPALQKTESHDMRDIKGAFNNRDPEASKRAHNAGIARTEEHTGQKSEYIKSLVFGGLDGIITTFAIVSAGAGAEMEARIVILLGIANLVSDGLSMGLGDYFSEKAEEEVEEASKERVMMGVKNCPTEAATIVADFYVKSKDFDRRDAEELLSRYVKYPSEFVDLVVAEDENSQLEDKLTELKDRPAEPKPSGTETNEADEADDEDDEDDEDEIWKQGLVTALAFWIFGAIPVIGYAIVTAFGASLTVTYFVDSIITLVTLAVLGVVQASMTGETATKKAVQMIVNGIVACGSGYLIAWAISAAVGHGDICTDSICKPPFIDHFRFSDAPWLSWESPSSAPSELSGENWQCDVRSWNDVSYTDTEHIFHMRVNLFGGENGQFEEASSGALPELTVRVGETYFFDQTHHTNWMHPLGFAYFPDGHHGRTWGGEPRDTVDALNSDDVKYLVNNVRAKRVVDTDIMEYDNVAYDSAFSHPKTEWLESKHGVQLTITDEIADKAAAQGGVIYYYSRFHSKTSGKIRIEGGPEAAGSEESLSFTTADAFDTLCGTYDTSPYRPDLGECATQGQLLCDNIDTPFERCMAALNCKMKIEMQVGAADASPVTTFLQQMIPHHANAINMARVLLKTVDVSHEPFVESLMNDIICGQTKQVTEMRARLGELGQGLPEDVACHNLTTIYARADMEVPYSISK